MKKLILAATFLASTLVFAQDVAKSVNPFPNAKVFFHSPKDGAVVPTTFKIKMGTVGMKVCEAGKVTKKANCGHHHIIIDGGPIAQGQVVPADEKHIHFGKMQKEAELTLTPGKHTLTLQFADYAHLSYGEKLSSTITVEVK